MQGSALLSPPVAATQRFVLLIAICLAGELAWAECLPGGLHLTVSGGPAEHEVTLSWTGADPSFEIYRAEDPSLVMAPENLLASTDAREWVDAGVTGEMAFYRVQSVSTLRQIGFDSQGADGNFDLDHGVREGARNGRPGAYVAYSWVAAGELSFVHVRTELGFIDDATPRCVELVSLVNDVAPATDPELGTLRWVHEVPTVAWRRETGEWELIYMTYPEDAEGTRLFGYGWLARKTMQNRPFPDAEPDLTTLDEKEQRLFVGLAFDPRLVASSTEWAEGEASDPVPHNSRYVAYGEPAAYADSGKLYLALVAMFCNEDLCKGDLILLRSDDGDHWDYLGVLLEPSDAEPFGAFFSYFTAPSIYRSPEDGTLRLLVTADNIFDIYQGLYEFEIEDLDAAQLVRDEQNHPLLRFEVPPEAPLVHTGAGSYHRGLGRRILGKHFPGEPGRFRVFTYEP